MSEVRLLTRYMYCDVVRGLATDGILFANDMLTLSGGFVIDF